MSMKARKRDHGFRVHVFRIPLDGGKEVAFFAFDGFDDAVSCPCGRAEALGSFLMPSLWRG